MQKMAVLGLGKMGHGIASRLLDEGHTVVVWNRTNKKALDLVSKGAILAATAAAAAYDVSVVFCMVADDIASSAAWFGPEGALSSMQPGTFAIECSTVSSDHLQLIAGKAKEKQLRFIDCPVTGLPDVARAGKLTLLVGADPTDLETLRPVLENISTAIRYFGPVGAGTAYKLIINLMGAVQIAALAEGVAMAIKLGLDPQTVIAAIETSAAASPQVVRHVRKMALKQFEPDPMFTAALRAKDARYALALARYAKSATPLGEIAGKWFGQAAETDPLADEAIVVNSIFLRTNA